MDRVLLYLPKEMAPAKEPFLVYALRTMVELAKENRQEVVSTALIEQLLQEADKRYGRTRI